MSEIRSVIRAKQRVLGAAVAYSKAFAKAEKLWRYDGEDPPDWPERMSKAHTITEDATKRLLKATAVYLKFIEDK